MSSPSRLLASLLYIPTISAQFGHIHVQNNTWNSNFKLSPSQLEIANITSAAAQNIEIALNFERTNWATGSVAVDPFYAPPPVNSSTPPGSLLAVEEVSDTNLYTIAPGLALSRILFVSETLNGTAIPASAYILWPWQAKTFRNSYNNVTGVPIVGWAHGTSGTYGECAPSHIRNLWYQYSAPYILALNGYAVVAPDYAGLGVNRTAEGEAVLHTYLNNPAAANDLFYAVEAAQTAFPELSRQFVTMGHSQGGGAAWAGAERQFRRPVDGYLGTVAGSPVTSITAQLAVTTNPGLVAIVGLIARGLKSIFPSFSQGDWYTERGLQLSRLAEELQGCNSAVGYIFPNITEWLRSDWNDDWYFDAYVNLSTSGGRPISGPMLVLQGAADPTINETVVAASVEQTCALNADFHIDYAVVEGVSHVPVLFSGQQVWLHWIEDRFSGIPASSGCSRKNYTSLRPTGSYQKELAYYLQIALESYTVA